MIGPGGEQRVGGVHGVREGEEVCREKRCGGKGEEVCREGEEMWREGRRNVEGRGRWCGMLRQNVPTGHAFDCYLWHEFSLFKTTNLCFLKRKCMY